MDPACIGHCWIRSLLDSFISLITQGISFGPFTIMVNQTLKLQYERDRASYLEALAGYMKQITIAGFESDSIPMMFSTFDDRGGYGGIMCTGALLKRAFLSRMKAQEDYLQASFQGHLDSGKSIDQTFKLSKDVVVEQIASGFYSKLMILLQHVNVKGNGKPAEQPFYAAFNGENANGTVATLRQTCTKSQSELDILFKDLSLAHLKNKILH